MGAVPAVAQNPSNSVPVFVADERALIGKYRFVENKEGLTVDVHLNADHTALYRVTTGEAGEEFLLAKGFWTVQGDIIHIHNRPGPVRLDVAGTPTRDPATGLSIVVDQKDGSEVTGLGVTWPDSNSLYYMAEGRHSVTAAEIGDATEFSIVRTSDSKTLQTIKLTRGGPNSFRFTYYPSDVEPFDIRAMALDARADRIEVELGTASAKLDRVAE